jgi:hypothetical protein
MNFSKQTQAAIAKYAIALNRYEAHKANVRRGVVNSRYLPRIKQEMLNARNLKNKAIEQEHLANYRKRYIIARIGLLRNAKTERNINILVNNTRRLINGSVITLNKTTREELTKNLNNAKATAERNSIIKLYRNIERKIALIRKAGPNTSILNRVNNARNSVSKIQNKNTRNKYYKNINNARIMNRNVPSAWRRGLTAEQLEREARIKGNGPAKRSWYNMRVHQMET